MECIRYNIETAGLNRVCIGPPNSALHHQVTYSWRHHSCMKGSVFGALKNIDYELLYSTCKFSCCFSVYPQIAEMIRHLIDRYEQAVPAVLEIPSKDHPYDPTKDSILRRAKVRHHLLPSAVTTLHQTFCWFLFTSAPIHMPCLHQHPYTCLVYSIII